MAPSLLSLALAALLGAAPPADVRPLLARGQRLLAAQRPEAAEGAFREVLARVPGHPAALHGLGSALFRRGQREEALRQLRAAAEAAPGELGPQLDLGYAALALGRAEVAVGAYARAVALAPDEPDAHAGLGESHLRLGARAEAVAALERALALPQRPSAQAWVERTRERLAALRAQGEAPSSTLLPGTPEPRASALPVGARPHPVLARERLREGDRRVRERSLREAAFAYQDAAHADPGSVEAAFKAGNAYAVLGYYAEAVARWRDALALGPDEEVRRRAEANIRRAEARMAERGGASPQAPGGPAEAEPAGDAARARHACEEGTRTLEARAWASAVQLLTACIREGPGRAAAFVARGRALVGLQRYEEAATDFLYARRLAPELSASLLGLAEAYRGQGRTSEARALEAGGVEARGVE